MRTKRQPARQSIWENRFGYLPAALSVGIGLLLAGLAALSGMDLRFAAGAAVVLFRLQHGTICGISPPPQGLADRAVLRAAAVRDPVGCGAVLAGDCRQSGAAAADLRRQYLGWHLRRECSPQEAAEITVTVSTESDSPVNFHGRCKFFSVFA